MVDGISATATIDTVKQADRQRCAIGNAIFQGSLNGKALQGTITGSRFAGTASGSLSGTTLDIKCVLTGTGINPPPYSGSLHLHR
jgi:hypothetical protein